MENNQLKYIKDALAWFSYRGVCDKHYVGPRGVWVRCSELNLIHDKKMGKDYYMSTYSGARFRTVYPYENWMEEYIGTDNDPRADERFKSGQD